MGPAVLITLGVLFLLAQVTSNYWLNFDRTWPALLIVIGLVSFLQHSASVNGHVPREYVGAPPAGGYRPPAGVGSVVPGAVVTPAPIQPGGSLPPANYGQPGSNPPEAHNG